MINNSLLKNNFCLNFSCLLIKNCAVESISSIYNLIACSGQLLNSLPYSTTIISNLQFFPSSLALFPVVCCVTAFENISYIYHLVCCIWFNSSSSLIMTIVNAFYKIFELTLLKKACNIRQLGELDASINWICVCINLIVLEYKYCKHCFSDSLSFRE